MQNITIAIPEPTTENDFTIIYKGVDFNANSGDKNEKIVEIKTSREELIRKLRYFKDKSNEIKFMSEYYIHDEFDTSLFTEFINSLQTKKIDINEDNYLEYYKLSSKYQYIELERSITNFITSRPDIHSIIDQLSSCTETYSSINSTKEILISKHLDFCLEHKILTKLPFPVLNRVLNSKERVLHNHHLLFEFIKEKTNELKSTKNKEYIDLLISSLDYNEMSTDEIKELLENDQFCMNLNPRNSNEKIKSLILINESNENRLKKCEKEIASLKKNHEIELNKMNEKLIDFEKILQEQASLIDSYRDKLSKFATLTEVGEIKERQNLIEIRINRDKSINEITFQEGKEFDGIFKYLTNKTGGNILVNKTVGVSSNSIRDSENDLRKAVDPNNQLSGYSSKDDGNAFICFDFKSRLVYLKSYSILSFHNDEGYSQLKNWVIEVSNDGKNWIEIDRHKNDSTLKTSSIKANFLIHNENNRFKRFIRLRQTGNSWDPDGNHNKIGFNKIELFGSIEEPLIV